jgi:hypothetical protein
MIWDFGMIIDLRKCKDDDKISTSVSLSRYKL